MIAKLLRFLPLMVLCAPVWANPAALCDQAALIASRETGVPLSVLQALTRAETGRGGAGGLEPWPWAVNQAGEGYWFDTPQEAEQFVEAQLEFGYTNLDVGCFQLNHRWHNEGFVSLTQMFSPQDNALYAARFIAEKYQETGDWVRAAGAYHSGTVEFAERYATRFAQILADLGDGIPVPEGVMRLAEIGAPIVPRINRFPLLMSGSAAGARGSLVPRTEGMGSLFAQVP